jgi:hypothetical protein
VRVDLVQQRPHAAGAAVGADTEPQPGPVGVQHPAELIELMVDAALGPPPEPPAPGGWRPALSQLAWGILTAMRRHPWALQVPITMPPITPHQIAWLERGFWALRDTPLPEAQKSDVVLLISGYVRSNATLTANIMAAATGHTWAGEVLRNYGELIEQLTDDTRHPYIRRAMAAGVAAAADSDPDDGFAFGLERVLDGIEVLIERS